MPYPVPTPEQQAHTARLLAQLSPAELEQLTTRAGELGRNIMQLAPEELGDWLDQLGTTTPQQAVAAAEPADWTDLEDFLDDTLQLSYKGSLYRLQAADIDTGLECQLLLGVGARLRAGGSVSAKQRERLEDAEETELFVRLLGGQQWLTAPLDVACPVCDVGPGVACVADDTELDADSDDQAPDREQPHDGRGRPNPHYRPENDVWKQLHDEGRSWAFVQHIGTTAIFWAAFGRDAALEFYQAGGRSPKAPSPAPKAPQDHLQASTEASSTPKRASGSSSPRKRPARKAPGGKRS